MGWVALAILCCGGLSFYVGLAAESKEYLLVGLIALLVGFTIFCVWVVLLVTKGVC